MPDYRRLDPIDIPKLLPILILTEIFDGEEAGQSPRIYVRLVGTEIVTHFGQDITGSYLEDRNGAALESYVYKHYGQVIETAKPAYWHYILRWQDGHVTNASRIYLPMMCENQKDRVARVLVGQVLRHDTKSLMKEIARESGNLRVIELNHQVLE